MLAGKSVMETDFQAFNNNQNNVNKSAQTGRIFSVGEFAQIKGGGKQANPESREASL